MSRRIQEKYYCSSCTAAATAAAQRPAFLHLPHLIMPLPYVRPTFSSYLARGFSTSKEMSGGSATQDRMTWSNLKAKPSIDRCDTAVLVQQHTAATYIPTVLALPHRKACPSVVKKTSPRNILTPNLYKKKATPSLYVPLNLLQ